MIRRFLGVKSLVVVAGIVMGLIQVIMVPPFQKPDEVQHFQTAAALMNGKECIERRYLDLSLRLKADKIKHVYENKFDWGAMWYVDENRDCVKEMPVLVLNVNVVSYLPSIIGVFLADHFKYPVLAVFLARGIGLLFFWISIALALFLLRKKGSWPVLVFLALPMVWQQATAVSYDSVPIILTPLIFAFWYRMITTREWWYWVMLLDCMIVFMLAKQGYYPLLGLLLFPLARKVNGMATKVKLILAVAAIVATVGIGAAYLKFGFTYNYQDPSLQLDSRYQKYVFVRDPGYIFRVAIKSWEEKQDLYVKSALGYFGWLDYQYDFLIFLVLVVGLCWLVSSYLKDESEPSGITVWGWLWVTMILLIQMALLFLMLYLTWTSVAANVLEGWQGRYGLVLVPYAILWIKKLQEVVGGNKRLGKIMAIILVMIVLGATARSIYRRYYDFSLNYSNDTKLKESLDQIYKDKGVVEKVSSINKFKMIWPISDGDVIGGFQFAYAKDARAVVLPYRYSIKDRECSREIRWGYLDLKQLQGGDIYQENFKPVRVKTDVWCVEIEALTSDVSENYFSYVYYDGQPLLNLLFIGTELKR